MSQSKDRGSKNTDSGALLKTSNSGAESLLERMKADLQLWGLTGGRYSGERPSWTDLTRRLLVPGVGQHVAR